MLKIKPVTTLSVAISTALLIACAPTQEAKNNTQPFKLPIPVAAQSADKDVKEDIQKLLKKAASFYGMELPRSTKINTFTMELKLYNIDFEKQQMQLFL